MTPWMGSTPTQLHPQVNIEADWQSNTKQGQKKKQDLLHIRIWYAEDS